MTAAMINFKSIHIEGFCSIGNLDMPLNERGIVLIKAPNGYGKSSILSALVWALYGKNLKGVSNVNTWKKYRSKEYNGTKVEVYFESQGKIHKVIRCSNYTQEVEGSKGGNRLVYLIDAIQVEDKNKIHIQSLITHNLGLSYRLFMNSIMFGQGLKRLIQESGTEKKELFEEIFELDYISRARELAVSEYRKLDTQVNTLAVKLNSLNSSLLNEKDTLSAIEDKETYYESKKASEIAELRKRLKARESELKRYLSEYNQKKLDKLKSKIEAIHNKISQEQDILSDCKHRSSISLEELIDKIIDLLRSKDYKTSLNTLLEVKEAFISIEHSREKIQELQNRRYDLSEARRKQEKLRSLITQVEESISDLKGRISKKKEDTPDFKDIKKRSKAKIKALSKEKLDIESDITLYSGQRELYKWAYTDPLGNNGIKAFLFESSLGYLNEVLDSYSDVLGFHIQFIVDLESARKDFQTVIYMEGIEVQYDELSGGQRQLCNLAMAFAMNEVMTQARGISIAFLDEVFENLSQDNIEIVVGLIKKVYKDKTLFLITHHESLPIPNSKTLKVQRIKGISHYQY